MATFKHISSKNADYGAAEQYLTFEHDEFTMRPTLDETGRLVPREDYRISSLNCGGEDFAVACMRSNLRYGKNQKREDVKSHHYIISFDPRDGTDNGLTVDRAQQLGEGFCKAHFPGHQALICTHPDGHNHSGNMVRWLVEQGADITIADKYGDRPYTVAVQNKNQELADYLKALEPEEWHNEQEKIRQLMPYKLPAKLVEYLKTGPLRLEFPDQKWVKWAELYSFMDVQEMTWKRKKLLSLMVQMDNYSDYLLLWSPRDKKLWYLDTMR